jgi:hypothetical protein
MDDAGARQRAYRVGQRVRVMHPRLAAYGQIGEIVRVDTPGGYHVRLEEEQPVPRVLFFLGVELAAAEPEASAPTQE